MTETKKIYILDVSGFLYRSYYALPTMTNQSGKSTHALYGFIRSVLKIIKDFDPQYIIAAFDGPDNKKTRLEMYAEYKSKRASAPEDLPHQMFWAEEFCDLYGIPKLKIEGVEADDAMGSVTHWAKDHQFDVFLCSGDKDLCQLVTDHVYVLQTHKDNLVVNYSKVEEIYGVKPEQITDYLALTGDASDNIPGVPGIGPKTAVTLLKEFHTLENLLANATQIAGKKRQEVILQNSEIALLSKRLAILDTSLNIPKDLDFYTKKQVNEEALVAFYHEMNFKAFIKEIGETASVSKKTPRQDVSYHLVDSEEDLKKLIDNLLASSEISFDVETSSLDPVQAELCGIGFCVEANQAWYVPTNGALGLDRVITALKVLFNNPKLHFYSHNIKFDLQVLAGYEIQIKNISFDTMLASYLLYSQSRQHSLAYLSEQFLNDANLSFKELLQKSDCKGSVKDVPLQDMCLFCCLNVDLTYQLKQKLHKEIKERHLEDLLMKLELPLLRSLARMERHGIFVDVDVLHVMSKEMEKKIAEIEETIYAAAGEKFNLNSPKQLADILQNKLQLPTHKKTSTGQISTSVDVLEDLAKDYPIAREILEYRSLEKLRSTYIDALPGYINPKTNRVHCNFNQSVAATGRLSCQNPNLQNIPVRTAVGREIRAAFRPQMKGWSYLAADYSQIELRLLAHLSEEPALIKAFENDEDVHAYTASLIFDVPLKDVTKEMRSQAKTVNFGVIYGQQAFGLAKELGIPMREAARFIEAYFARYPKVQEFLENCKKSARLTGKAVTVTGREREIPEIHSKNMGLRGQAERLAINTPLQGFAADLIKKAMLVVDEKLRKQQMLSYMILQIHDELLFEAPDFELIALESLVRESMQEIYKLKIPLRVDIAIGKNWKEC